MLLKAAKSSNLKYQAIRQQGKSSKKLLKKQKLANFQYHRF